MEGVAGECIRQPVGTTTADEAVKKNTDCIYFLASPLTCKKGIDCEYRHSEGARANPRDCWYWFNGSCLNQKCSFRHPPLDGLFGIPGPVSRFSEPPSKLIAPSPVPLVHGPVAQNTNKQNVPCYYFQMGNCSKGERCSFVHKTQPANSYILQHANEVSVTQSESSTKIVTNDTPLQKVVAKQNVSKPNEILPIPVKSTYVKDSSSVKVSSSFASQGLPVHGPKRIPLDTPIQTQSRLPQHRHVNRQNDRESEDLHKDYSPGPNNRVDHYVEDSDRFRNEGRYLRAPNKAGMRSSIANDYAKQQPDHDTSPYLESDHFREMRNHNRYETGDENYDRELGMSSVRTLDRQMPETNMLGHEEKYEKMDNLDLRLQLKQKRLNGSRSAVNFRNDAVHIRGDNDSTNERYQTRHPYHDRDHFPKDSSISSRLRGRIALPSKPSPDPSIDLGSQVDREGTGNKRKSPKPISSQLRRHESIKKRLGENPTTDSISGQIFPERDDIESLDFAPPKRLAELKRARVSDSYGDKNRSLKSGKVLERCKLKSSLSFEGPKPLNVLLKRKRDVSPIRGSSPNVDNNSKGTAGDSSIHPKQASVYQIDQGTESAEEGLITEEGENLLNGGQHSAKGDAGGSEEGLIMDSSGVQEFEDYGDGNRESDGGEAEDADYKVEDDDNVYQDYEDDDEDEDDFAKKVGIMLS